MLISRPELTGTFGAVSSTHWLASAAGMRAMAAGGNAFDAAVTAAFVLQVVEPHFNGPGGDVSIVAHRAGDEDVHAVCGQGPMPMAATTAAFADAGLAHIPGSGLLPACVPGSFGAWLRLLAEFGTMRLTDVLAPAIGYAERGFPLLPAAAAVIDVLAPLFREEWIGSARTYLPGGVAPPAGSVVRNRALAATYQRIVRTAEAASTDREAQLAAAHDAFYRGFVAEEIHDFIASGPMLDATGRRNAGLLTGEDLARWEPTVERAARRTHGRYTVHKPGVWSQGPVFLQQLALLDGVDIAAMGLGSADHVHTVVEGAKLAFADREAWYGDPDFTDIPLHALLSDAYATERRPLVGGTAHATTRPGSPDGRESWIPALAVSDETGPDDEWMAQLRNGLPTILPVTTTDGDTCTVTAVDRHGNMVAATPSGGWLESSPAIERLGFPLGTRGQSMTLAEGHPNSLAPRKRPRTTLSPTVVLGRLQLRLGFVDRVDQRCWVHSRLDRVLEPAELGTRLCDLRLGLVARLWLRASRTGRREQQINSLVPVLRCEQPPDPLVQQVQNSLLRQVHVLRVMS